ncbi:LuxR C-terminal-related transcriptional regulator [Mucilaginibacter sabulilitoris]|uniref:LuxR C-terminal-related transcriptional regulator n=1 Tax=Mucilaginibacter sabulilitoris TaxID=1173583 RepID=A0ABZ0TGZ2_9SPHI|nr:LuxR C-terminal-related transcriptional regulator [Mucilaginibacter sabulilitoris]WPU91851.1 LuxR C-terminal-related transcriptional regulator [Mucilaginibacter sabulilitoris]
MNYLINSYGIQIPDFDLNILTQREIEVMRRVILPGKEIAYDLNISENTLNSHMVNIRNKTRLMDIRQIVCCSMKKGLIN